MRSSVVWIVLVCALVAPSAQARAQDAWLAPDKGLHFGVSLGIAAAGYGLSSLWSAPPRYRALAGFSLALGAGIAKETWDAMGHGDPSWRDFTWDLAGSLSGTALAWGIDLALERHARTRQAASRQARSLFVYHF